MRINKIWPLLVALTVLLGGGAVYKAHSQNAYVLYTGGTPVSVPGSSYFISTQVAKTTGESAAPAQNATKLYSLYIGATIGMINNVAYDIATADNTANVYDLGLYGPNCTGAATNVPLVWHTGAVAGSSFGSGTGAHSLALSGAPVIANITPGYYCLAITSSAASPSIVFGGDTIATSIAQFTNGASPGGGTGTTSGGALNATITTPATSAAAQNMIYWVIY